VRLRARAAACAFVGVALVGVAATGAVTRADDGGAAQTRRDRVVARIGDDGAVTVGELEDVLASMPRFQRATYGATADAIRRRVLEEVAIPHALLARAAAARGVATDPATKYALDRARSGATVRALRARVGDPSTVGEAEARAYYAANHDRYESAARYQIWRILCATRDEALAVLAAAQADATPSNFETLAREHSLDKATNLRAGNLGFLDAEGAGVDPGVRVDSSVVQAAMRVRDGDLVASPVPEGEHFAVVWRRGTRPGSHRAFADAAGEVRRLLADERTHTATRDLVASLRAAHLRDLDDAPLAVPSR
jgi:peptidyl-prolyl cis-trans isomerase C